MVRWKPASSRRRQVVGGQVSAPVGGVLADVPEDVGELEREAEGVGVLRGALGPAGAGRGAEDAEAEASDGSGDAPAVGLEVVHVS